MDVFGIQDEYDWVVKVLKSSICLAHIDISSKLLSFLLKKWDGILNEDQKITFLNDFKHQKVKIIKKIKKNHPII